jgi:flagellar basal body P-ring formation protein FlgA
MFAVKSRLVLALLVGVPAAAQPGASENLDLLDSRIAEFTGTSAGLPGGAAHPLDRRLNMPACKAPPLIESLDAHSLAVRCAAPSWRIRVPLSGMAPGQPASTAYAAKAERLIKRGDMVEARYEADEFDLLWFMLALEDGTAGANIRVKNPDTGHQTTAVVVGPGTVTIFH